MSDNNSPDLKRSTMNREWTQGSIINNLLLLSWPMIVMEATYMVSQLFDMVWVGKAGASSIAALGIANLVMMLISTVDMGLISGSRAMIARFVGERDMEGARKVAGQTFILAVSWGLLVTIFGSIFASSIMNMFGVEPAVAAEGVKFLRVFFAGWLSLELLIMSLYTMQSTGDSFSPMLIEISIRVIHIALCPFLVLGLWIFPELGITGAALSNVISQALGAAAGLWFLFRGYTRIKLSLRDFRFVPNIAWRMLKIGLPSLISMVQANFSMFVVTWIIVPFGTQAIAANSLASNVQGFVITPNLGLGSAVGVLVGQNLGAKKPERAVKSTWLGAGILQAFLITCGIIILIWAEKIVMLFNSDPALVAVGASFLRIGTAGYLVMGINSALMNCISGAGDTLPNMLINIVMIWVVQIPLSYLLSNYTSLSVYGIRWAYVASNIAACIAYFAYFRSGRWKHKKV
ncbi:MAG: MATE family efflux transporter [Dehalococcoidales bacterium]